MKTLGVMLDCSRNAVMKPEKVKEFAKIISQMGYNMLQLYTEDTYEIEGEPFFGHMRGRYTKTELKDIDSYCQSIGVELVPCIQTLAHLNQLVQWEEYKPLFDCNDILMVGESKVYDLIDKMFITLEECFSTRRVHVGMDEAHFLGRGKYQDKYGYRDRLSIMSEHLSKVNEIAKNHGFNIMMWSDMFIRLCNDGRYEDCAEEINVPERVVESVPEEVELIYWEYGSKEKEYYDRMIKIHKKFKNPIGFAGGMWVWKGYSPNLSLTWDTMSASIQSLNENTVDTIIFTLWGDDGKECSFYTMLPMLFSAAQMLKGNFDQKDIALCFEKRYGYSFDEFMNLELANTVKKEPSRIVNPSKYLLFNDPFIGKFDFTTNEQLANYYKEAATKLEKSITGREYDYIFDVQKKLLDVLSIKCDLGVRLRSAYQRGNREEMSGILKEFAVLKCNLKLFFESFRTLWLKENKPFGLEIQEQRFGGLFYRIECCEQRLKDYLDGRVACIEELEEKQLAKSKGFEGEAIEHTDWRTMISVASIW